MRLLCLPVDNPLRHRAGNLYSFLYKYSYEQVMLLCEKRDYYPDDILCSQINAAINGSENALIKLCSSRSNNQLLELAVHQSYKWLPGYVIKVKFLNSEPNGRYNDQHIIDWANEWNRHANISFEKVDNIADSDLRFEYSMDNACWSMLGTNAKNANFNNATIHLTFFGDAQMDRANVLHEFGHALGCVHEHQSPAASILWNIPTIYSEFHRLIGWNRQKVNQNVISQYSQTEITNSTYDNQSIMIYPIHDWMTIDGYNTAQNFDLSAMDKTFIAKCYPF